jgi:hypothetical protein
MRTIVMGDDPKQEPLEGFHIADYGAATETVTISVHRYLLKDERQREALAKELTEAIKACLHSPCPEDRGDEVDDRGEALVGLLVASGNASKGFYAAEEVLAFDISGMDSLPFDAGQSAVGCLLVLLKCQSSR